VKVNLPKDWTRRRSVAIVSLSCVLAASCSLVLCSPPELEHCGQVFRLPAPYVRLRIASSPTTVSYLVWHVDLHSTFARISARTGWNYLGQAGSGYTFSLIGNDDMWLDAVTEGEPGPLMRLDLRLRDFGSGCAVMDPSVGAAPPDASLAHN
jgi:hypothetical protein